MLVDVGGTLWSQPVLNPVDRDREEWERRLVAVGIAGASLVIASMTSCYSRPESQPETV